MSFSCHTFGATHTSSSLLPLLFNQLTTRGGAQFELFKGQRSEMDLQLFPPKSKRVFGAFS